MLPVGTIIDNRYEIVTVLGTGGFGAVYGAVQRQFDRQVAIKVLNTTLAHAADGVARFEREAIAINALKHKNIVGFYGYGVWQQAPYMVMELVQGTSLFNQLANNNPIEAKRAVMLIKQVFEGLGCAHASGIVHRDLKPTNIMLEPNANGMETVKLIDFGLAKLMPGYGIPGQKLTETGYALGSCHYMPPEQAQGGQIDQRADIYSAGCIFYHMLVGRFPFDADNNIALMMQHIMEQPLPLIAALPDHPMEPALSRFVGNCIAKDPANRYQDCHAALADLNAILQGQFGQIALLAVPTLPKKRSTIEKQFLVTTLCLAALCVLVFAGFALSPRLTQSAENSISSSDLYLQSGIERALIKARETYTGDRNYHPIFDAKFSLISACLKQDAKDHQLTQEQRHNALEVLQQACSHTKNPDSRDWKATLNQYAKDFVLRARTDPSMQTLAGFQQTVRVLQVAEESDLANKFAEEALRRFPPSSSDVDEIVLTRLSLRLNTMLEFAYSDPRRAATQASLYFKELEDKSGTAFAAFHRIGSPFAHCVLGDAQSAEGRFKEAEHHYQAAFSTVSKDPGAYDGDDLFTRLRAGFLRCIAGTGSYTTKHLPKQPPGEWLGNEHPNDSANIQVLNLAFMAKLRTREQVAAAMNYVRVDQWENWLAEDELFQRDIEIASNALAESGNLDLKNELTKRIDAFHNLVATRRAQKSAQ